MIFLVTGELVTMIRQSSSVRARRYRFEWYAIGHREGFTESCTWILVALNGGFLGCLGVRER